MVKLDFYTKHGCIGCRIMYNTITNIMVNGDIPLKINTIIVKDQNAMPCPTIIINGDIENKIVGTCTKKHLEAILKKYNKDDDRREVQ